MIYTIIEEATGKELFAKFDNQVQSGQVAVTELRTEEMVNPHFDFETRDFFDKP
jgi:catalase